MTTVVSLFAASIAIGSLVPQIIGSVSHIQDFLSSIKDGPEDIRNFLKDLEILAELVSEIKASTNPRTSNLPDNVTTKKALTHFEEAAASLTQAVDTIKMGFSAKKKAKRTWAAVTAVLKEKMHGKLLFRIARAISILILAQQVYQTSLLQ